MTTRTAANPVSPKLKDALFQLSMAVRELVGPQAHAKLMRTATGSDVNAGQTIYQPSKEPTARTQLQQHSKSRRTTTYRQIYECYHGA